MNVGMLWYEKDHKEDLGASIRRAAAYYENKYGRKPNTCFLNPETANGDLPRQVGRVTIKTSPSVLAHHFWLGVEERKSA